MIHPTAIIHPQARLGADCEIGPYCDYYQHMTPFVERLMRRSWSTPESVAPSTR